MEDNKVAYPAIIHHTAHQTQIHFPDLPAADVTDPDEQRARLRAKIGLAIIIIDLESHYETVPAPSSLATIKAQARDGSQVELIWTDLSQY